jgi:hypothetical protein
MTRLLFLFGFSLSIGLACSAFVFFLCRKPFQCWRVAITIAAAAAGRANELRLLSLLNNRGRA